MRFSRPLVALSWAAGVLASSHHRREEDQTAAKDTLVEKQFIVQVEPGTDVEALSKQISAGDDAKILKVFKSDVFTGLTVESEKYNLDSLNGLAEIRQAWPVSRVSVPPLEPLVHLDAVGDAQNYSVHSWTGVDRAHQAGIRGKGVKVAVVDTGIDYEHAALGGSFGPGRKVVGGYDLVGNNWSSDGPVSPDKDPMDQKGHGTHVAGIIAGQTEWFSGVAPDATLLAYKVFSTGTTLDSILIEAFIMAYEDGADVITASVGSPGGWSNGAWATVASNIVQQGVIVTIAAANDGNYGPFYANSGSSGKDVLAVASVKAGTFAGTPFELSLTANGKTTTSRVAYRYSYLPWTAPSMDIYPLFLDDTDDQACSPEAIPANTPDLSKYVVLVKRGRCDYQAQEFNLASHGAANIMFYNNGSRPDAPSSWLSRPKALVEREVGEAIVATVKAGGKATGDFAKYTDGDWYVGLQNSVGNRPSEYTSWGGLYDLDLKPDVSAPGGEILSSWLGGGWRVASGTSMACPYVAGIAALYLGHVGGRAKHGKETARMFNRRVVSSGAALPWSIVDKAYPDDTGYWAPTIQAGSGLVDAWKVLTYTSAVGTARWSLNDTEHFSGRQGVDITNGADVEVEYEFQLQPAAGVEAASKTGDGLAMLNQMEPLKMVPDVKLPSGKLRIGPGETKKAEFVFDYPRGLDEKKMPLYSGKVLISSSRDEQLSIPYFGAAFSLRDRFQKIFIDGTPFIWSGNKGYTINEKANFTFDIRGTGATASDYPRAFASFKYGCDELRWDIYEPGWKESRWEYPPVVGENGYIGAATAWNDLSSGNFDPEKHSKEATVPFPVRALYRNIIAYSGLGYERHRFFWFGKLANGSYINPGKYQMRFAALRPLGDRAKSTDWDIWETPEITVLPLPK